METLVPLSRSKEGKPPKKAALSPLRFWLLAMLIGLVGGCGAWVFRGMIAFLHNVFFLGKISFFYEANVHTPPGPWGPFIIFAPVVGAIGVTWLVQTFAPEARGHGVPEVMDAIYYNKSIIRPVVAVIKSLASALSIGSGGSVGREGPIIQIGSAFGSTVGQWLRIPAWQRTTLIAAGAGAGIAATFNTPIGGILFAAELLLHEVSVWTLVPVAIATASASYVGRFFFGPNPAFAIPELRISYFHLTHPLVLIAYVGLGLMIGLVSVVYIRSIYAFEDFFDEKIRNPYLRHTSGMLLLGIMMYVLLRQTGAYQIEGVGYATIQDVLSGTLKSFWLLLLLFALKLFATSLTLGSGASGGVFSPALFLGATLGGAYGIFLQHIFPGISISPAAFAVVGMAGIVGGTTGAAITAIVMIFEMTLDYGVIVPMTTTVAIAYGVRKMISNESIYTLKLTRRGHRMPSAMQANIQYMKPARELNHAGIVRLPADMTLPELAITLPSYPADACFVAMDGKKIAGVISIAAAVEAVRRPRPQTSIAEIASRNYAIISADTSVFEILTKIRLDGTEAFLMAPGQHENAADGLQRWISKESIAESLIDAIELFSE
ncbi:MAG TPA: chloride channel protein [Candidatus Udaeobacter sp.]|nr:chloride channel protein [Candidatus Udaeobacter sp.]